MCRGSILLLTIESMNPSHATGFFLYPLKTPENQRFSDVFRGNRKRPVAKNRLNILPTVLSNHGYAVEEGSLNSPLGNYYEILPFLLTTDLIWMSLLKSISTD